jgi:hypothetical protein
MPKVNFLYGCFGRLKRDASKTTDIRSGEWTHVRGRKTFGMSEKEISKFVRELEVAPKKMIPYHNPCGLPRHSKKQCNQKQCCMKQSKKTEKAKKGKNIIEPTTKMVEKDLQKNITELCKSENSLYKMSIELGRNVMRSKGLIEVQKKLFNRLFELEVARTSGLQNSPLIISNAKNPRKISKKLPLCAEELEQFERILTGKDKLDKLDDRFTDYMIYLEQIKECRLELYCQNDYANYTKLKYVGPGGILHKKPSANPKLNTRYYEKVKKKRISSPRMVGLKNHNNMKRVRHVQLLGIWQQKNAFLTWKIKQVEIERVKMPVTSSRLERVLRHVLDLQDRYHSAQKKVIQLSREFQLRTNKPAYQQHCREIRKDLCDTIDEVIWKQKDFERENRKLKKKKIEQRTFTWIERAYAADLVSGNTADISTSYDQGPSTTSTASVKLTNKEKIWQLQMMLHELEDEVHSQNEEEANYNGRIQMSQMKKERKAVPSLQPKQS